MHYQPVELMRGVWGLEDRLYSADEIAQSFHLRSAANAGAFENAGALEPVSGDQLDASETFEPKGSAFPHKPQIDLRDNVSDAESELAPRTVRQRHIGKSAAEKEN